MSRSSGTELVFLRGLPKPTDAVRVDDSPKRPTTPIYLTWADKSEGELLLQLMLQDLLIDKNYYGDPTGIYTQAENMLAGAIRSGLHTSPNFFRSVPKELEGIAAAITTARRQTKPADRYNVAQGISTVRGVFDPYGNDPFTLDCSALVARKLELEAQIQQLTANNVSQTVVNGVLAQLAEVNTYWDICQEHGQQITLLNTYFEKSAHDYTYNYLTPTERNNDVPTTVSNKAGIHQNYLERMALISGLSYGNLSTWGNLGIKRKNVNQGTQPWTGNETAYGIGYANYNPDAANIGGFPIVLVAQIIIAAAPIILALIESRQKAKQLKEGQTPSNQYQLTGLIGTEPGLNGFDPSKDDWAGYALPLVDANGNPIDTGGNNGNGGNSGNDSSSSTSPLLIAAGLGAAYLFLNQKSN